MANNMVKKKSWEYAFPAYSQISSLPSSFSHPSPIPPSLPLPSPSSLSLPFHPRPPSLPLSSSNSSNVHVGVRESCVPVGHLKEKIMMILKKADKNNDGVYTRDELKQAFKELKSHMPSWRAILCVREVDFDGDGNVNGPEEIESLINYIFVRVKNGRYKIN